MSIQLLLRNWLKSREGAKTVIVWWMEAAHEEKYNKLEWTLERSHKPVQSWKAKVHLHELKHFLELFSLLL